MKVSIIIPVYNVEPYITECLESVANQTYTGEMECLIVDDCGLDNSIAIAEEFIQTYQGQIDFKIIHHTHNRGLSAARNTGIDEATGDYVYFLDSDDAIVPDTIELMMQIVKEHPQVEMVQGGFCGMDDNIIADFSQMDLPDYTNDQKWIISNVFLNLPVTSWNRLLKKDFLQKENIKSHEGLIHQDVPFCYLLSLKCNHIGFVRENTYRYRQQRKNSITNTSNDIKNFQARIIIMNDCIDAYIDLNEKSNTIRAIALKMLWTKWLNYMAVHNYSTLKLYQSDLLNISKRMVSITPWPQKGLALAYQKTPLRIRKSRLVNNMFEMCL